MTNKQLDLIERMIELKIEINEDDYIDPLNLINALNEIKNQLLDEQGKDTKTH